MNLQQPIYDLNGVPFTNAQNGQVIQAADLICEALMSPCAAPLAPAIMYKLADIAMAIKAKPESVVLNAEQEGICEMRVSEYFSTKSVLMAWRLLELLQSKTSAQKGEQKSAKGLKSSPT